MAATVTALLSDITLGESGDSTYWTGTDGQSTEIYRQGSGSEGWVVSKNANETGVFDSFTKNGLVDMSGTDVHLYITMRCDIAPYIDYVRFALQSDTAHGSASSGTTWWTVVDNTTNIEWVGEWITIALDVNNASTDADSSGTLDLSAITDIRINVDNSNSGNIRSIENTYIDTIRYGTGLKITGTAWDWDDVALIDGASSNKYDILRKVGPGVFEVFGQIQIGDGATTTTPSSSNETIFCKDESTSGVAGGPIGKLKPAFYKVTAVGSGCSVDFSNVSVLASSNRPVVIDISDTNLPASLSIDWDGGTIIQCSSFLARSGQSLKNMGFYDCGQVDPSTSAFENNLVNGYTGTDGALLWPGGTTVKNSTFSNCDRAIEITQAANQTFDALLFSSNTYDVHLNNGGTNIDVSKNNGSNPSTYVATGGGTVTFVGASVTVKVTVQEADGTKISGARVFLPASASATGGLPYQASVTIVNSGTTATVTHTSHGLATGDKVVIEGASLVANNGVHTVTVTGTNTYTYTMTSTPGSSPTGTIISTFVFVYGISDVNGEVSTSRVLPADQASLGWARKTSSSPYFKTGPISGTVSSSVNTNFTAILAPDE